jgi:hypothetical protein
VAKLTGKKKAAFLKRMEAGRKKAARKNTGHKKAKKKKGAPRKKGNRGTVANPAKGRIGKKGTGWLSAKAVKIVRRRGKPDQVLVKR